MVQRIGVLGTLGIALWAIALLAFIAGPAAAQDWTRHRNARFGFAIDYPRDLLRPLPPPVNNDGRKFESADRSVTLMVYAGHNVMNDTIRKLYRAALAEHGGAVSYKAARREYFVVSGAGGGRIFYRVSIRYRRAGADLLAHMRLDYAASARERVDPLIGRMFRSFRASVGR